MTPTVVALFVSRRGPYWGRGDVDAWDELRDARRYDGSLPVVAHPPCARWCRLAKMVEDTYGYRIGDDGGCFEAALVAVQRCGGVLEHPAWSLAWKRYGLTPPPKTGWLNCSDRSWVCAVAQSAYGHRAKKMTWLYYVGEHPPAEARWDQPAGAGVVSSCTRHEDGTVRKRAAGRSITKSEAKHTPLAFAEYLLDLAKSSK